MLYNVNIHSDATNYDNMLPWKVKLQDTHTVPRQEIDEDFISSTINRQYSISMKTAQNVLGLSTFIMWSTAVEFFQILSCHRFISNRSDKTFTLEFLYEEGSNEQPQAAIAAIGQPSLCRLWGTRPKMGVSFSLHFLTLNVSLYESRWSGEMLFYACCRQMR